MDWLTNNLNGWAAEAVGASIGGLFAVASAVAAILLTRRADRKKLLEEASLRAVESVYACLINFSKEIDSAPQVNASILRNAWEKAWLTVLSNGPAVIDEEVFDHVLAVSGIIEQCLVALEGRSRYAAGSTAAVPDVRAEARGDIEYGVLIQTCTEDLIKRLALWRRSFAWNTRSATASIAVYEERLQTLMSHSQI
ncbi:hypothetical protein ACSNOB_21875 [Micromonospora sp. URMC 106]|uniref:hypothetical protein n=1 Tax=Micromonospora sp. URMC 106 TaxID=3423408 RepID=UPI003F1DA98A